MCFIYLFTFKIFKALLLTDSLSALQAIIASNFLKT